jgi:hypothetical protein
VLSMRRRACVFVRTKSSAGGGAYRLPTVMDCRWRSSRLALRCRR